MPEMNTKSLGSNQIDTPLQQVIFPLFGFKIERTPCMGNEESALWFQSTNNIQYANENIRLLASEYQSLLSLTDESSASLGHSGYSVMHTMCSGRHLPQDPRGPSPTAFSPPPLTAYYKHCDNTSPPRCNSGPFSGPTCTPPPRDFTPTALQGSACL